jgi:hypothetical protein
MSEVAATFKAPSAPGRTGTSRKNYLGAVVWSLKEPAQVSGENRAGFLFLLTAVGHRRSVRVIHSSEFLTAESRQPIAHSRYNPVFPGSP